MSLVLNVILLKKRSEMFYIKVNFASGRFTCEEIIRIDIKIKPGTTLGGNNK
jgi:hypothetical protein